MARRKSEPETVQIPSVSQLPRTQPAMDAYHRAFGYLAPMADEVRRIEQKVESLLARGVAIADVISVIDLVARDRWICERGLCTSSYMLGTGFQRLLYRVRAGGAASDEAPADRRMRELLSQRKAVAYE